MKLVCGLGNPGRRYADSRHNIGYRVVDELARRANVDFARHERKFEAFLGDASIGGQRVLLLKPTTFMNLSGRSVSAVRRFYKMELSQLLVVHDDLDLPVGRLRVRSAGSAGGHRGMIDVIRQLSSEEFARLRIGIGSVHPSVTVEYVLSGFSPRERELIDEATVTAAEAVECWVREGIDSAMNEYNRKPRE